MVHFRLTGGFAPAYLLYNMSARADGEAEGIGNYAYFEFKLTHPGWPEVRRVVNGFVDTQPLIGQEAFEVFSSTDGYRLEINRLTDRSRSGVEELGSYRSLAVGSISFEIAGVEVVYGLAQPVPAVPAPAPVPIRP